MISKEDIEKVADLAKLKFTQDEISQLEIKMEQSLSRIKIFEEIDTENIEPLYQVHDDIKGFREDREDSDRVLSREDVLANTKEQQYGYFKLFI